MKILTKCFFLSSIILLGVGCSNDSASATQELQQSEIRLKIAEYYSAPSLATQPVAVIKAAFDKKFPNATDIEWRVSKGIYSIDFEINGVDYEAWYDSKASLLMYKHDIFNNELSPAVASAVASDYPGYIIDEVEKVYKGNINGFYIELDKNKEDIHVFYNEDGSFISKTLWEDDSVKPGNSADTPTPDLSGTAVSDDDADALVAAYYSGYDTDILSTNVPSAIAANFRALFPTARDIDWDVSNDVYKVDFEINNVDYDAWYRQDGTLLMYKFDISRSTLPTAVKNSISTQFSGYVIEDAEKVLKPNSVGYFVELESRNIEEDAYFSEDGIYISKSFYKKNNSGNPGSKPSEPNVPSDGSYTDAEIDALLLAYHRGKDRDIRAADVPALVITAFNAQFTSAWDIEWDYVGDVYNVDFEIGNTDYEAWYMKDGTILMYMKEIRYSEVPMAVQSAVASKYANYKIDGADYFQKGSIKGYLIELENKKTDAELIVLYKEDGSFISEQYD